MKKEKHPYHWLVNKLRELHPYISVSNNHEGGILVISVGWQEMEGSGRVFLEDHFLECVRYIRKHPAYLLRPGKQLQIFK